MKRLILALAFLMPMAISAAPVYTFNQTHLDNQTFTFDDMDTYISYLLIGENQIEFGHGSPVYYEIKLSIDPSRSNVDPRYTLASFRNSEHGFITSRWEGESNIYATGQLNTNTISNLYYSEPLPDTGLDFSSELHKEIQFDLVYSALFGSGPGSHPWFEGERHITFGSGNTFSFSNESFIVPEPTMASLLGLGLAFAGYRRFKK